MKDRTRTLMSLAGQHLNTAKQILPHFPNNAAFHSQQCVEKSAKAPLWEISDSNGDELRKKIKHDSILAVMKVLSETAIVAVITKSKTNQKL